MSYDPTLGDPVSRLRLNLDDTGEREAEIFEDIIYEVALVNAGGDERLATADVAEKMATRLSREASQVGLPSGLTVSYRDRVSRLENVAKNVTTPGNNTGGGIFSLRIERHGPRTTEGEFESPFGVTGNTERRRRYLGT